jgi:hypothetical protein
MGADETLELLRFRNETTLLDFLRIDLDLGKTFAELARLRADLGEMNAARRVLGNAEQGYETVERFSMNIEDPDQKNDILRGLGELRTVLEAAHQRLDIGAAAQPGK